MNHNGEVKIFSGSSSIEFATRMCQHLGIELGKSTCMHFTEGNTYVKIEETVRDKDVYLVETLGLDPNNEFAELLFWIDAFKRASANSVTVIMPYFSYAKGDKKDEPRVSIRGRVCAECIELAGADRVVTMDLHSPQIQGFFKVPVDHLYAMPILCEFIKSMQLNNMVVVSPDAGYAKDARKFAKYLKADVAIGDKTRTGHDENAKILDLIGDVDGKDAVIVDDFSISGGTLIDLSYELKKRGAKRVIACLSHILLNDKGIKRLEESPIELLISTDSVCNEQVVNSDKVRLISVAPLFAETIRRIHNHESVSPLFNEVPQNILKQIK
ncbi:ribose-phosphate diphosphokinase [Vallitalea okinawensis]|uniref:ribose-phosphate diphosphokinase n=1 Tax=Vallitalea okinawensis TaxID=2078660 RepID=UPI000CFAA315|nr:ribose-phosphate diphosphokinase [Vallitalea okinawensis]